MSNTFAVGDRVVVESTYGDLYDGDYPNIHLGMVGTVEDTPDSEGDAWVIWDSLGHGQYAHVDGLLRVDDLDTLAAERSGLQVGDVVVIESNITTWAGTFEEGGLGSALIGHTGTVCSVEGDEVTVDVDDPAHLYYDLHRDSFLKVADLDRLAAERAPSFTDFTDGPLLEWERELLYGPTEVTANAAEGNGEDHSLAEEGDADPADTRRAALKEAAELLGAYGYAGRDLVTLADYILTGDIR